MLNVVDECTHEAIAIGGKRKLNSTDVIDVLSELFLTRYETTVDHSSLSWRIPDAQLTHDALEHARRTAAIPSDADVL